jgi:hypothetical protein
MASLIRSWWVFLFLGVCFFLYYHFAQKKESEVYELRERLSAMEKQKAEVLEEKEDLLLQIHSQNDPAWIEMTLMKGLGVVPEGKVKIYFKPQENKQ